MKIEALFFGMSRDLAGQSPIIFELDEGLTVKMFREILVKNHPGLSEIDSFAIAVNESYAEDTLLLTDNDTVAIIPPVSGG
ncbi:molybdopterin converting factor subunit 1 [Lutimonas sp.]|jgi:molybdopterin converting factor subunit 1|uniref:molybdopterin converting factor subunit 1 n=1 Tax=Lutimonas sp. TaxID=1872403 RepID=UPI003C75E08C